jgi:hypothetical protein
MWVLPLPSAKIRSHFTRSSLARPPEIAAIYAAPVAEKRQTVMVVTGAVSDWEYLQSTTDQSLKRQSAFNGGKHD